MQTNTTAEKIAENRFTLIEVILAVAIFALAASTVTGILFSVEKSYNSIRAQNQLLELKLNLETFSDNAFRNIVPFNWPDSEHLKKRQIFLGEPSRMIFAYLHPSFGNAETGLRFVELFVTDSVLYARWRPQVLLYWNDSDFEENSFTEALAENVKNVSFTYADKENNEIVWYENYDSEAKESIPLAIAMTVELNDGTVLKYLRRTAGNSFYSTFGKRNEKQL